MLLANKINPPEIKRDPSSETAAFEVRGCRNHVPFTISGSFPIRESTAQGHAPTDEALALKHLLRDIANSL